MRSIATAALLLAFLLTAPAVLAQKVDPPPLKAGMTFHLSAKSPRFVTADAEFRDPAGVKWPNFAWGKPADDGTFVYDPKQPSGSFSLNFTGFTQVKGDQSRRVIGPLIKDQQAPKLVLNIKQIAGPIRLITESFKDDQGRARNRQYQICDAVGELTIGETTLPIKAPLALQYPGPHESESIYLSVHLMMPGSALGITGPAGTSPVQMRFSVSAYPTDPNAKPAKKK